MSPAERVTLIVADPLNLIWIMPAEGSTREFENADPSRSAFFMAKG
jgi:hypothetical protein